MSKSFPYHDEESLVRALRKGDKHAFRELYYRYEKNLFYFLSSLTKSQYMAEEVLQEVFIKVWTRRKTLDPNRSLKSFIYTIAANQSYNLLRDTALHKERSKEMWQNIIRANEQTEEAILSSEYEAILENILKTLPVQKRSIYILSRKEGKSNDEIAGLLGIAPKTVKNHLWKTLQTIREALQPYLDKKI